MDQRKSTTGQKRPSTSQKKSAPHKNNASKTKAFDTVNAKTPHQPSPKVRKRIVIAIFVVVILILAALATLIIGQVWDKYNEMQNTPPINPDIIYIEKNADAIKVGSLLIINEEFSYSFPTDFSDMVNLYQYQRNDANKEYTHINDCYTYSLTYDRIYLNQTTLDALNSMLLDYCKGLDLTDASKVSVSNLEIAWGGYSASTVSEYTEDVNLGKGFYDHALGTTFTIKQNSPSTVLTENLLKSNFKWISENAHKYGFIVRYPGSCKDHNGEDSSKRVHLRYIGIEHATYIYENGICLDEYLELLRTNHGFDNPLSFTANGKNYQVYYVKYSGNPTQIPVLKDSNYSISGDNMNGFIVTVEK